MKPRTSTKDIAVKPPIGKDGWPEYVPVLEAGDIGKGCLAHVDDSPCCTAGWLDFVFPVRVRYTAHRALAQSWNNEAIGIANDRATPAERARKWNAAMELLGYDVKGAK